MSDLTIPLIGMTTFVGYLFSKVGKERKANELPRGLETFEKPNGSNVYNSNKVEEVQKEIMIYNG
jgi:hypothetical protein